MRNFKVGDKVVVRENIPDFSCNWYKPGATGVIVKAERQDMIQVEFTGGRYHRGKPGRPARWWVGYEEIKLVRGVDYVPEVGDIVLAKLPGQRARPAEVLKYLGQAIWQVETINVPIKTYEIPEADLALDNGER